MNDLQTFLTTGVFAFLLAFVRVGTVVMMMPGIGNTFVSPQVRLYFALAFAFVIFPLIQASLPPTVPAGAQMVLLIGIEFVIGFFIGTIARTMMSALDTAGFIISTQSSLANAQLFNPQFSTQGSVIGAFITLVGIMLLFATDLYHLLILGMVNSYNIFPIGQVPDVTSMTELLIATTAAAFAIGIQITAPFILIILLLYIGMAVLSKLMPQMQVFMIAMPLQIILALVMFALIGSSMMLIWLAEYEKGMTFFLRTGE